MEILSYRFMQYAFIVGIAIAIMAPLIGNFIVIKRLSPIGDALSHSSLAGILLGLFFGVSPLIGAIIFTVVAVIVIEVTKYYFKDYNELTSNIIMGLGVGITGVLMNKVNSSVNINSYIFGSIVTISIQEVVFIILIALFVILYIIKMKDRLLLCTIDEDSAKLMGFNVKRINFVYMLVTAVVIAITSKIVGALIVTSLTIIPVACSMQISRSFNQNIIISILFAITFITLGLIISYYLNLVTGGTTILISVITLLSILILNSIKRR